MISLPEPSLLKQTAETFKRLLYNDYIFRFSDKTTVHVRFFRGNYHHLVGLQKFTDVAEVTINKMAGRSATAIFNSILSGEITEYNLQQSVKYTPETCDRLRAFLKITDILSSESLAVMPFVPELIGSTINADILLFKSTFRSGTTQWYLHLFLKEDKKQGCYIPISFFEQPDNYYIKNQTRLFIDELKVLPFTSRKEN